MNAANLCGVLQKLTATTMIKQMSERKWETSDLVWVIICIEYYSTFS